jgi:hypothetical protein
MSHPAVTKRGTAGPIGDQDGVLGAGHLFVVDRQRLHQLHGVDALLVANTPQIVKGQPGKRHDRRAVKRGIVKTVHQMDRAGAGRADADAKATSMFGPSGRHEGGGLFMPHGDITYLVLPFSQRLDNRVDAVADDPEHVGRAPVYQRLHEDIRGVQVGAWRGRRLRRNRSFRFRALRRGGCSRSGSHETRRGGDLEEITAVPSGKFAAAHGKLHVAVTAHGSNSVLASRFNPDRRRSRPRKQLAGSRRRLSEMRPAGCRPRGRHSVESAPREPPSSFPVSELPVPVTERACRCR